MGLTNLLKILYEKMPKGIKFAFSPIFIRLMVQNKEFQKTWKELDYFELLPDSQKKTYQFEKAKQILEYAYQYVPYYRELFDKYSFNPYKMKAISAIERLPLLEKDDAIKAGSDIYSTEKSLKYYKTFTGGSSGHSLTVLLEKDSIYRERACVTHFMSKFGYDPLKSKTVFFMGHNKGQDFYYSPLKNEIVISPFRLFKKNEIDKICDDIKKFGATFLMGYPSAIFLFSKMVKESGRRMHFQHIIYCSENYNDDEKSYVENVFGCSVNSYYGHTERACFAEIYDTGCVFSDYYGYTELIPTEDENEFRIVCTGFMSKKMPLIRYATDDVIRISEDGRMTLIGHRKSEIRLIGKNGEHIFKGALTMHLEELKKAKRYQFVQNEKGKADLCIVENETMTKEEINVVQSYLSTRCEGVLDVNIKIVDELILTSRGKFNWAICNIREGN